MIKNERQLQITKRKMKVFEATINVIRESQHDQDELMVQLQIDSIQGQIVLFAKEIEEYEKVKSGQVNIVITDHFDVSKGIINGRIARGYSHAEFARKIGLSEQQVQKYEAENYSNTSLKRLQQIIALLDIDVHSTFKLSKAEDFHFLEPENANLGYIKSKIRNRGTTVAICR